MEDEDEKTQPETDETDTTTDEDADDEVIDSEDNSDDNSDDEDNEDGEEDEDGDGNLGQRAQKRIKKLVGRAKDAERRVKELEGELEDAKKTSGDDAETYVSAARASGILPGLMGKDLAQAIERREENRGLVAHYENWLDDEDNEELQIGDRTLTRKQVRARVRELKDETERLERRWGAQEAALQQKVRDIFELGRQAMKAGWKPGAKAKPQVGSRVPRDRKEPLDRPNGAGAPTRKKGGKVDWGSASGKDSLASLIQQAEE